MKGQLIFRIFVDISSYPYEFFVLRDFIICSIFSLLCIYIPCLGKVIKSLVHKMSMIIHIFTSSFNIFCDSNKILIKSFSSSLLIRNFSTFHV